MWAGEVTDQVIEYSEEIMPAAIADDRTATEINTNMRILLN